MVHETPLRGSGRKKKNTEHAYPADLAAFVAARWADILDVSDSLAPVSYNAPVDPLPELSLLEEVLSTCYQASLLHEEDQPVIFRLALSPPEVFPTEGGPPDGLQRLEFSDARPFDVQELRRLSPATDYPRSIVGVSNHEEHGLHIWGLLHSGPRWLRDRQGGRVTSPPLPPLPVVHVTGPGRLEVRKGSEIVAKLENGALSDGSMDVFDSEWMPAGFATARAELLELHAAARERALERDGERWALLAPDLARRIGVQMFKRLISTVQNFGRDGDLLASGADAGVLRGESLRRPQVQDQGRRAEEALSHPHRGAAGPTPPLPDHRPRCNRSSDAHYLCRRAFARPPSQPFRCLPSPPSQYADDVLFSVTQIISNRTMSYANRRLEEKMEGFRGVRRLWGVMSSSDVGGRGGIPPEVLARHTRFFAW